VQEYRFAARARTFYRTVSARPHRPTGIRACMRSNLASRSFGTNRVWTGRWVSPCLLGRLGILSSWRGSFSCGIWVTYQTHLTTKEWLRQLAAEYDTHSQPDLTDLGNYRILSQLLRGCPPGPQSAGGRSVSRAESHTRISIPQFIFSGHVFFAKMPHRCLKYQEGEQNEETLFHP
jgi:hypothetical protein